MCALMYGCGGGCPVSTMARLPGVSRSGYYAWLDAGGPQDPPAGLKDAVTALREGSDGRFGWRSVKAELPPEWAGASGYSVRKSMRELGIRGPRPGSRRRTTVQDPDAPAGPDLAGGRLRPPVPTTVPCGDITYLRAGEGRPCLAAVAGLATRMVAGRCLSARMAAGIRAAAPGMAKRRGHVAGDVVSHSDRGSRCTGAELAGWAAADDVGPSVGRTGCCRDNAAAEGLRVGLKNEMYYRTSFATREEAKMACIDWIERCCNWQGPHSAVGCRHPAELMGEFEERAGRAFADEVFLAA